MIKKRQLYTWEFKFAPGSPRAARAGSRAGAPKAAKGTAPIYNTQIIKRQALAQYNSFNTTTSLPNLNPTKPSCTLINPSAEMPVWALCLSYFCICKLKHVGRLYYRNSRGKFFSLQLPLGQGGQKDFPIIFKQLKMTFFSKKQLKTWHCMVLCLLPQFLQQVCFDYY